jgi:L-alanine-DL-glutamate epimerase-like enolase superfamily enzyme
VCALLGGLRKRVPTYASGALMRPHPVDYLAKAGPRLVGVGFRQMKMQCGSEPSAAASIERVRVMREAIGPDIDLMCDINQLWSVHHAIEVGRRLEPYQLYWLEDPTTHDDYAGLARIADGLTTPIAAGEYHYGIVPFRHLLEARSIDIVMIDLLRVGGITQWMKVAGMAEAFNVPVVSHLVPEIHVHLVAAVPNGLTVEYMPWSLRLWEDTPPIEDGQLVVPAKPGLGLAFDQAAVKRFEVK